MIAVELAGRGIKYDNEPYLCLDDAVNDVYDSIKDKLDGPFAIFDHSMGSWIAYELYYKILKERNLIPIHLFMSGNSAPHIKKCKRKIHTLDDEEFKEEILKIGQTSKEVFSNVELCNIFLPILKMDYKIIEEYTY